MVLACARKVAPPVFATRQANSVLMLQLMSRPVVACRYGELEQVSFGQDLAAVQLPSAAEDAEAAVSALGPAAAAALAALAAALERCRAATGLTGLPELQLVADEELAQFVSRLQVCLPCLQ